MHEDLSGIRIIQSFTAEDETKETFRTLVNEHQRSFMDAVLYADAFGSVIDFCWGLGNVSLWYTGIMLLGVDTVSVGTLVAFGTYISMFWQPIMNLSNFYNQLITNISGAERIFEILDTDAEIVDAKDVTTMPEIVGAVDFDHVGFSYEEGTNVLNDVSFHINPGETIALVGPTGAGKTTIVNLISRFYNVDSGTILIDGTDISHVTLKSLRRQMGIMMQDSFIFSGTIMDNIRYGNHTATDEDVIRAAKTVCAHDFIMELENGYQTEVNERGSRLSAGQRQLISFARALLADPKILILDEATSSIDTETEIALQKGLSELLKGRTSFIIAHRLSTIRNADCIMYVDRGNILEKGTHEELMALGGEYYRLYMSQYLNCA